MKIVFLCIILQSVLAQNDFGKSYLKGGNLCSPWTCLNTKLGLPDDLPPRNQTKEILQSLLPQGSWQKVIDNVLEGCYVTRDRKFVNTCPGQALWHCIVDRLIHNCPDENWPKDDTCSPLSSLAGFRHMFAQSRYPNLAKNLPEGHRSVWFTQYYSSKCCDLPSIFNDTVLQECGFSKMINYYTYNLTTSTSTTDNIVDKVKVVDNISNRIDSSTPTYGDSVRFAALPEFKSIKDSDFSPDFDPLECCETDFIKPSWRSECGFQLNFSVKERLTIVNNTILTTSTSTTVAPTTRRPRVMDVKITPLKCEKETCIFRKLDIISETGAVDIDAFSKFLDNVTNSYPEWTKAKARVVTKCLSRPIRDYVDDCEINKVLACTFDVLSENCPNGNKTDPCKHLSRRSSSPTQEILTCQISTSKFRPRYRRQFCGLPDLVNHEVLSECGVMSLYRTEVVPEPEPKKIPTHRWTYAPSCKELTDSSKCVLNNMGVLSKYNFIDYFKMKAYISNFTTSNEEWALFKDIISERFSIAPLYTQYCSSTKKLLNVVDIILSTCPVSKRRDTAQCNKFYEAIKTPISTELKSKRLWHHFQHVYMPRPFSQYLRGSVHRTPKSHIHKNPLYDFGFLNINSKDMPPVTLIDVKPPKKTPYDERKTQVILPVYLRSGSNKGILGRVTATGKSMDMPVGFKSGPSFVPTQSPIGRVWNPFEGGQAVL